MVERGHFDYGQTNRARVMQGNWARVALLFKQYAQNMTYLLVSNFVKSVKTAKLSKAEVKQARMQFLGIVGGHFLVSGAFGLPTVELLGGVANILAETFGDDDEPWDYKTEIRNYLADKLGKKKVR